MSKVKTLLFIVISILLTALILYPIADVACHNARLQLQQREWNKISRLRGTTQTYCIGNEENPCIPIVFNDAQKSFVYGTVQVTLPTDDYFIEKIQQGFGSLDRFMNDLVRDRITVAIFVSGSLMSKEEFLMSKNTMMSYITDQLQNGIYKTVRIEETTNSNTGEKKTIKKVTLVPDENAPGGYKRSDVFCFTEYGIKLSKVSISILDE